VTRVAVLAGGYGGAKLSHGLALLDRDQAPLDLAPVGPAPVGLGPVDLAPVDRAQIDLTVIVNTGDDLVLHGLHVSPDLDTVMYTLAGLANTTTGWGVRDETWSAAEMLARFGAPTWFGLGDRDLATNVLRTQWLGEGQSLTEVTGRLARALDVPARILPATDDVIRTRVRTRDGWLDFQDYFVRRGHSDDVLELDFVGAGRARPTADVLSAIQAADVLVFAPSNPFVSIGTILAIPGVVKALLGAPAPLVAVSPIVAGSALRGPADRMFASLGGEPSALGVARHYAGRFPGLVDALVIDRSDAEQARSIEQLGLRVLVADAVMTDDAGRARLARETLAFGLGLSAL